MDGRHIFAGRSKASQRIVLLRWVQPEKRKEAEKMNIINAIWTLIVLVAKILIEALKTLLNFLGVI